MIKVIQKIKCFIVVFIEKDKLKKRMNTVNEKE